MYILHLNLCILCFLRAVCKCLLFFGCFCWEFLCVFSLYIFCSIFFWGFVRCAPRFFLLVGASGGCGFWQYVGNLCLLSLKFSSIYVGEVVWIGERADGSLVCI